jgi:hypothetical protein
MKIPNIKFVTKLQIRLIVFLFAICASAIFAGFVPAPHDSKPALLSKSSEGKAYWFVTFTTSDKKMYFSYVFNNDCDHCGNEIREAFKKYLVMNDYETTVGTQNMSTYHDVDKEKLIKRRDDEIYRRKQQTIKVINVNFSYKEN